MNQIYIGQKLCEGNESVNELDNFIIFSTRTHNSVKKIFKKKFNQQLGANINEHRLEIYLVRIK